MWVWDLALCATVQQSLHLDTPLLEIQNTEKLHRTENNSVCVQLGQILDQKIQKDKKEKNPWLPFLKSHEPWVSGAKACTQYHRVGAGRHLSHPSSLTSGHTPALSSNKEWAHTLSRSKQGGFLVFIFSCSRQKNPNRALPEFLVWSLVNFYWLRRAKNPGCIILILIWSLSRIWLLMGAKCASHTQVIILSSKHFDNVTAKKSFIDTKIWIT